MLLEKIEMILEENGVETNQDGELVEISSLDYISILVAIEEEFNIIIDDKYLDSGLITNKLGLVDILEDIMKENT